MTLNLRVEQAKKEALDAIFDATRETFQLIKADAKQMSPRSDELKPGEPEHNADSIQVRVRRTKQGPKGTVFTESGHGGYLEVGTSKMSARPYIYPALVKNAPAIAGKVRIKINTKIPKSK